MTMASTMFADRETKQIAAARPMPASLARIETLLDKVADPVLAKLWRQICPLHVNQLPDRQGIIADLADFAEVLQPRCNGPQLCRLIKVHAVEHRRSHRFVRNLLQAANVGQSRVVADAQRKVRLKHHVIDARSVAVTL